jgi:hypothetical protein
MVRQHAGGLRVAVIAYVAYLIIGIGGLVVLRASVESLDFLSLGWILVLVLLPLLPWLLPRFGSFLRDISPYVESLKLGGLQLDFRALQRDPLRVPTSGALAQVPNDVRALSSGTAIASLVEALRDLRRKGGSPVVIIDLQEGRKWRLPNLYFFARLLEIEPIVSQLLLTEVRRGIDGYLVGVCRPLDLRRQIEQSLPAYGNAAATISLSTQLDLGDAVQATEPANAFQALSQALGPWSGGDDDPAHGYVTPERIVALLGEALLSTLAVEGSTDTLSDEDVRAVLSAPHRFVPATSDGRVVGLIDREAVALVVARAAVARPR